LTQCVGDAATLRKFFDALYFGTIPEATALLKLDAEHRSFSRIRSLAYRPEDGSKLLRRQRDRPRIPVKVAPLDRCLKSRGSNPPRTWVSGLAARLKDNPATATCLCCANCIQNGSG